MSLLQAGKESRGGWQASSAKKRGVLISFEHVDIKIASVSISKRAAPRICRVCHGSFCRDFTLGVKMQAGRYADLESIASQPSTSNTTCVSFTRLDMPATVVIRIGDPNTKRRS
jgi:hypothetical protein